MQYYKTPFRLVTQTDNHNFEHVDTLTIVSKSNQIIAEIPVVTDATKLDAEYILRACNTYPKLIEMLDRLRHAFPKDAMYRKLIEHYLEK